MEEGIGRLLIGGGSGKHKQTVPVSKYGSVENPPVDFVHYNDDLDRGIFVWIWQRQRTFLFLKTVFFLSFSGTLSLLLLNGPHPRISI